MKTFNNSTDHLEDQIGTEFLPTLLFDKIQN